MSHPVDPILHADRYQCPDHFWLERKHPGLIAAWAIGLLALVLAIGLLGTRLKMGQRSEVSGGYSSPAGVP